MDAALAILVALILATLALIALLILKPSSRSAFTVAARPAGLAPFPQVPSIVQTLYQRGLCVDAINPASACSADADCAQNANNKFCNPASIGAGSFCGPTKETCKINADCTQNTINSYCNLQADGSGLCGAIAVTCNRSADCARNPANIYCAPNPSGEGGLCGATPNADGNVVCDPGAGDGDCAGNATNTYCGGPPGGGGDAAAFRCAPESARAAVVAAAQAQMMAVESNYALGAFCTGDWQCASGHCLGGACGNLNSLATGAACSADNQCTAGGCGRPNAGATARVCCNGGTISVNGAEYCANGVGMGGACWYNTQCPYSGVGVACQGANVAAGAPGTCAPATQNGGGCWNGSQCVSGWCPTNFAATGAFPGICTARPAPVAAPAPATGWGGMIRGW